MAKIKISEFEEIDFGDESSVAITLFAPILLALRVYQNYVKPMAEKREQEKLINIKWCKTKTDEV